MTRLHAFATLLAAAACAPAHAADDPAGMLGTTDGATIYATICQGCHMPGGRGAVGAGRYPAFAGNPALASPQYVALTILAGRNNMPAFARPAQQQFFFPPTWLSDEQVANVTNYIRSHFGNAWTDTLGAADVRALRPAPEETP